MKPFENFDWKSFGTILVAIPMIIQVRLLRPGDILDIEKRLDISFQSPISNLSSTKTVVFL